jgi:hypothetical protein
MLRSKPFWWVVCDAENCGASSTEGSDYAAWASDDGAEEDARDGGWLIVPGDNGDAPTHWCPEHLHWCLKDDEEHPGTRDDCRDCAAEAQR